MVIGEYKRFEKFIGGLLRSSQTAAVMTVVTCVVVQVRLCAMNKSRLYTDQHSSNQ